MDYNKFLQKINAEIIAQYPDARLYEIHGKVVPGNEGGYNVCRGAEIAFGLSDGSLVCTINDDNETYTIEKHGSPWVEDRPITPYLPSLGNAIKAIEKAGYSVSSPRVTLRHQLFITNIEPQYIISENGYRFFVGVWSGELIVEKTRPSRGMLKTED